MGWSMVIFLAALQSISQELYEAAAIDGAGGWKQYWHITLPLIRPTILFRCANPQSESTACRDCPVGSL